MNEIFGVTLKRALELTSKLREVTDEHESLPELEELLESCQKIGENENEKIYCGFLVGVFVAKLDKIIYKTTK